MIINHFILTTVINIFMDCIIPYSFKSVFKFVIPTLVGMDSNMDHLK